MSRDWSTPGQLATWHLTHHISVIIIIVNIIIIILPVAGTLNQRGRGTGEPGGRGSVGHLEAALARPGLQEGSVTSVGVDRDEC